MSQKIRTRRASKFDGKQRGRQDAAHESRPHNHFNGLHDVRKAFMRWLHVGR